MRHQARKRFGQNFLHDPGVIQRIVAAIAPQAGERIVEIGPGRGAITRKLLRASGALDAVELDRDLIAALPQLCAGEGRLRLFNGDALKFDFCRLAAEGERLRIVGNLPYNVSTPLLFHLLQQAWCIQDMHFMLQREVVDRMVSGPGSKHYGRLSVMLQIACEVQRLFDIGPGAFHPPPKVESSFVRLCPLGKPRFPIQDPERFHQLVRQAFSQRRKTLRNTLRGLVSPEQMGQLGIDPRLRAENLDLEQFTLLANAACKSHDRSRPLAKPKPKETDG